MAIVDGGTVGVVAPSAGVFRPQFNPAIQGLRGACAISVFLLHLYEMSLHAGFFPEIPANMEFAWSTLGQGVAIFFMISGFVIPASLERHKQVVPFLIDRAIRIMPLMIILQIVVFAIGPLIGYKFLANVSALDYFLIFVTNVTFTSLPLGLPLAQQNSWTLTYEWCFYITICVFWLTLNRNGMRRVLSWSLLAITLTCFWYFPVSLYFLLGLILSRLKYFFKIPAFLEVLIFGLAVFAFYFAAQFVNIALALVPACLLFVIAVDSQSLIYRALSLPLMQFLGKISYSLYLVHPFSIFPFIPIALTLIRHGFGTQIAFIIFILGSAIVTLVASTFSYFFIEQNLTGRIRRWVKKYQRHAVTNVLD